MEDKDSQFLDKLSSGPRVVSLYFGSDLTIRSNRELVSKYNIEIDVVHDLVEDFFISDFSFSQLRQNVQKTPIISARPNEFICDFLGKLFLPVAELLKIDVEKEINFNNGKISDYKKNIDEYNSFLEAKSSEIFNDIAQDFESNFDAKEEEKVVVNFLSENILGILLDSDNTGCYQMNGSLVYLLINKKDSLPKFSRALLSNNEKVSEKKIILEGKEQEATISNLIKHFIEKNGSGMFSSIVLAKYLSSSEISNVLDEKGKKVLRKILKIYRNLVFFPDSMANISIDEWEIFPLEDISSDNLSETIKISKEKREFQPVDSHEEEIKVLKELLQKYPNKSLEKKAIESEIKKIEEK